MGIPVVPKRVLLFIATLYRHKSYYYSALNLLEENFGEIFFESSPKLWHYSTYYEKEMGSPLFRRFIFFRNLISEGDIAKVKLATNQIEIEFSSEGKRNINLDPGYIGLAKLVLATTKDYSHRIYLKDGIYGEVTLIFRNNSFVPHLNTYRDYADSNYIELFNLARKIYKNILC